ncbi:hypothetical protein [Methylobacterium soli]|uniref:PRC-barrel domain containing protein n=1 Tax=Methylobacterium soli TaxID=553447 RepID=A0A6L3SW03_9HYPH|nr:hypothetical protein [Methylobacterium soli]KAB1076764.1 hypothetical protein F6X53_22005 [Methylobacterium soli]GJE42797.1 hypothetical protein AEGHOMDF_1970 [Methylobacterium soli]
MSIGRETGPGFVRRLTVAFALGLGVAHSASAQGPVPPSRSDGWDNAYYQILAESLRRMGQGQWVYSSDGHAVGRIADVRTSADGMRQLAVVRLRRLLGGGQVAIPVDRLARRNGRIVAQDDRTGILAAARLAAPGSGRP